MSHNKEVTSSPSPSSKIYQIRFWILWYHWGFRQCT